MKPNYKNWVPKGMVSSMWAGSGVLFLLLLLSSLTKILNGNAKIIVSVVFGVLFVICFAMSLLYQNLYNTFDYNGKKQLSRKIIDKLSDYVKVPDNGVGLDIGCGSGALTIACAKKNPNAKMVGLDRWGKEYASFSNELCNENAKIEGVADRTSFVRGDACKIDYPDESFDAVTSNYCYHNIPSNDRQKIILETLRVLKKGGTFAIHDEFTKNKYGDTDKLVNRLKEMGYEKVELLDTTDGLFISRDEAKKVLLVGSKLLVGKK